MNVDRIIQQLPMDNEYVPPANELPTPVMPFFHILTWETPFHHPCKPRNFWKLYFLPLSSKADKTWILFTTIG